MSIEQIVFLFFIAKKQVTPVILYETPSCISMYWPQYQLKYRIHFDCPSDHSETSNPHAANYFEPFADFIKQMKGDLTDPGSSPALDVANRLVSLIFDLEAKRRGY